MMHSSVRAEPRLSPGAVFGAVVLMLFAFVNPPFLYYWITWEARTARVVVEAIILMSLGLYVFWRRPKVIVGIVVVFCIYAINFAMSGEQIVDNALSHFNKLAFILSLATAFRKSSQLTTASANLWMKLWTYCAIAAAIGFVLHMTRLVTPILLEEYPNHPYYNIPFLGNFMYKPTDAFDVPRYTGFLDEPIEVGMFCGFNMLIAEYVSPNPKKQRRFFWLNLLAGLLTASIAFSLFLGFFALMRSRILRHLASNKVALLLVAVLSVVALSVVRAAPSLEALDTWLPYSSLSNRAGAYQSFLGFLSGSSITAPMFGVGAESFHDAMRGGASAGILDTLGARGLIVTIVWLSVLYTNAKHVRGLFAFIVFYSLVLDYWTFPLFILGLTMVASLEARDQQTQRLKKRAVLSAVPIGFYTPIPASHSSR